MRKWHYGFGDIVVNNIIKQKIVKIVEENGVEIDNAGNFENIDSLKFVSTLVSIEQEFNIIIPDDYLVWENTINVASLTAIVENELSKTNA